MDRQLKGVVGHGSTSWVEVGRWSLVVVGSWLWLGRGWVVAEVAPVIFFLNGFAPVGFKSWLGRGRGSVSNRLQ